MTHTAEQSLKQRAQAFLEELGDGPDMSDNREWTIELAQKYSLPADAIEALRPDEDPLAPLRAEVAVGNEVTQDPGNSHFSEDAPLSPATPEAA